MARLGGPAVQATWGSMPALPSPHLPSQGL